MSVEGKTIQSELSLAILLADRVVKSAHEAESSKLDCSELARQADRLTHTLRSIIRLATSSQSLYERPLRRILDDVTKNLDRAVTLTRRCKHGGFVLRQVFAITTTADFRKASSLLESSLADIKWVLSILESSEGGGSKFSLAPIAQNDPILAWVWSSVAAVQMGQLRDRVEAANELASLARDNDRNKKIIVEEGGIPPLLRLLKESSSPEAQIAAATALCNLATDQERVRWIAMELGVPIIVKVLGESPIRVQVPVANLVSKMAEMHCGVQEELGRENVTRPLVTLLSMDVALEDPNLQPGKPSLHSLVQINKELTGNRFGFHSNSSSSLHSDGGSSRGHKKEREVESPELKLKLKISCAEALWRLSRGSLLNSRKITETKALLCLAKLIEKETGDLQINCLITVMELAAVAESNADLRRVSFKPNSPAAKPVLEQLLRVINEETNPGLLIPAVKAVGSLARTFPAKETRMIEPLIAQLSHRNGDVATEASVALGKFVSPENYNCVEHSKTIIEFGGVPRLMSLLRPNDRGQVNELKLLCHLALHVANSKALEQARALNVLEGAARAVVAQHPDLRELFANAIHHLTLYQAGVVHTHKQILVP